MQTRIFISCTFLMLLSAVLSFAQINTEDTARFSQLVYEWNQYHNTKNMDGFKSLYAPAVLFYGKYEEEASCLSSKSYFLNDMQVSGQHIISPVITAIYAPGTVKCSFTKQVDYKQHSKAYQSYLLFEKRGNEWKITGESNLETDQHMHVQLTPGNELTTAINASSNRLSTVPLGLIVMAAAALLFYFIQANRKKAMEVSEILYASKRAGEIRIAGSPVTRILAANVPVNEPTVTERIVTGKMVINNPYHVKSLAGATSNVTPAPSVEAVPVQTAIIDANKKKGDAFENMIVSKFRKEYYTLLTWRSDKIHEGRYPKSNGDPDFEFKLNKTNLTFAIECKYRSDFYCGTIEWAKEYQLDDYKRYAAERHMPVFVMIGVGGEPSNPNRLYVIPLQDIHTTVLTREELHRYERLHKGAFYFDVKTMQVK